MRIFVGAILLVGLAAPAAAQDEAAKFVAQAERCWNIPAGAGEMPDFVAEFDVTVDAGGMVQDIAVVEFFPSGQFSERIVRSASKGIERCAPYDVSKAGIVRIKMTAASMFEDESIDPFKKAN